MTDHETELRRIVAADPLPPGAPDLAGVREHGRRALRRRRTATIVGAAVAVAAVAAPTYLVANATSGPDGRPDRATGVAGAPDGRAPTGDGCGVLVCEDAGSPERGTVSGTPLVVSSTAGFDELLYVADGALMLGHRDGDGIRRAVWATEPGSGPEFWSNVGVVGDGALDPAPESIIVVGYVDGSPAEITWSSRGETGPVEAMSTEVADGVTVFAAVVPLPEGFDPGSAEEVETDQGPAIKISPGDERPEVTIHTSDGWSCSLSRCGSVG